jgi:hypothetical protein
MIIMGGKKKGGSALAVIMKKLGSGKDYDSMKEENLESMAKAPEKDGVEQDHSTGMEHCVDKMMEAMECKDKSAFKAALKDFIEMAMK